MFTMGVPAISMQVSAQKPQLGKAPKILYGLLGLANGQKYALPLQDTILTICEPQEAPEF